MRTSCVRTVVKKVRSFDAREMFADSIGHRKWECPKQRMYSANVICRLCGGGKSSSCFGGFVSNASAGHMARDCRGRGDPNLATNNKTAFDSEYSALMEELGEHAGQAGNGIAGSGASGQASIPPWRIPENWNTNSKSARI